MNIINLYDKSEKLYYIGGIVRDEILGKTVVDIDITYEGNAIEFARSLDNVEILQVNEQFGTVKILANGNEIDLASTRFEFYPKKGHLPIVENIGCSLKEDVLRRDFTINALAKNLKSGEIIDFTGGLDDLKNGILRVLHDESFIDDPTRIIRGLKFAVRFGFSLDEHTKKLQENYLSNVNYDMSYKRLKDELMSAFNLNSQKAYDIFVKEKMYKLLSNGDVQPVLHNIENLVEKYKNELKHIWLVYLGGMNLSALELTREEKKIVDDAKKIVLKLNSDYEIYKTFEDLEIESVLLLASKNYFAVEKYLDKLRYIKPEISGKDIQDMGYEQSKRIGECLNYLQQKKIENPKIKKEDEIRLVRGFM